MAGVELEAGQAAEFPLGLGFKRSVGVDKGLTELRRDPVAPGDRGLGGTAVIIVTRMPGFCRDRALFELFPSLFL